MSNVRTALPLLVVVLALLACKKDDKEAGATNDPAGAPSAAFASAVPSASASPEPVQGAESPEKAYEQLKRGALARDYRAFFNVLHVESQNMMLAGQMIGAAITLAPIGTKPNPDKKKELDEIFAKHGVKDDGSPVKPGPPEQMMAEVGKKLEGVEDRPGLFHDLMLFLEKNSLQEKRVNAMSLEGLKEQGTDKATATSVNTFENGKVERQPIEFRRQDERWTIFITKWR